MNNIQYGASDLNMLMARETARKKSIRITRFDWKIKEKSMLTKLKKSCSKFFRKKYSDSYEIYCVSLVNRIINNKSSRSTCFFKENLILNEPEEILISYIGRDLRSQQQISVNQENTFKFYPNYLGLPLSIQNILNQNIISKQNLINKENNKNVDGYKNVRMFPLEAENQIYLNSDFYKMLEDEENFDDKNTTNYNINKINDIKRDYKENSFSSIEKLIDKLEDVIEYNILTKKENNSDNEIKIYDNITKSNNENNFPTSSELKTYHNYNIESLTNTEKVYFRSEIDSRDFNSIHKKIKESHGKEFKFINNEDFLKKIQFKETEMKKKSKFLDNMNNKFKVYFEELDLNELNLNKIEKHNARLPEIQKLASRYNKSKKQQQDSNYLKPNLFIKSKNKNLSEINLRNIIHTTSYKFQQDQNIK